MLLFQYCNTRLYILLPIYLCAKMFKVKAVNFRSMVTSLSVKIKNKKKKKYYQQLR